MWHAQAFDLGQPFHLILLVEIKKTVKSNQDTVLRHRDMPKVTREHYKVVAPGLLFRGSTLIKARVDASISDAAETLERNTDERLSKVCIYLDLFRFLAC